MKLPMSRLFIYHDEANYRYLINGFWCRADMFQSLNKYGEFNHLIFKYDP